MSSPGHGEMLLIWLSGNLAGLAGRRAGLENALPSCSHASCALISHVSPGGPIAKHML